MMNQSMKTIRSVFVRLMIPLLLFHASCSDSGDSDNTKALALLLAGTYWDISLEDTFTGPDYQVFLPDTNMNVNLTYTLDLGTSVKSVFFVFTNTNTGLSVPAPIMRNGTMPQTSEPSRNELAIPQKASASAVSGKPEIAEFNRNPLAYIKANNPILLFMKSFDAPPRATQLEDKLPFMVDSSRSVAATCKKVISENTFFGTKTLSVFVADNCWISGGTKNKKINQDMVDAVADKFLKSGTNNDIYDWVSAIFGEEWGSGLPQEMIGESDEITILIYDIDDDEDSVPSGCLGYFWAKDNFKRQYVSYSNERIMFYIDSGFLATQDGGTWEISDTYPSYIISTLAHEFQHMIHFYQKTVLRSNGYGSEAWIDEMCSLVTEDLVAYHLGTSGISTYTGPRGVLYSDPSAGGPGNEDGRLPMFNSYNYISVTTWYDPYLYGSISYSINYALGSYLARNFGGATFFRNVVRNNYTDSRAITYALAQAGSPISFGEVLRYWGAANILSDKAGVPKHYQYNKGSWETESGYQLGSINLYNYRYNSQTGPRIYSSIDGGSMYPASNVYVQACANCTGTRTWNVRMPAAVRLTVVVK